MFQKAKRDSCELLSNLVSLTLETINVLSYILAISCELLSNLVSLTLETIIEKGKEVFIQL